jgi:molybdenum cofactor cytidylyltransferase
VSFAVVLAAGRSSRVGRNKALLPVGGVAILDLLLEGLASGGIDRAIVVASAGDRRLAAHCAERGIELALNERPERGMLSSVWTGLDALPAAVGPDEAVVICPVDVPFPAAATVAALLAAVRAPDVEIAVPTLGGRRGHPLALRASLIPAVRRLDPAVGLHAILARPHTEVAVDDPGIHRDLDTWRDLAEPAPPSGPR